jgi:5'-3' exonuclease
MGVPKLFKWISERYPLTLTPCEVFTAPDIGLNKIFNYFTLFFR